MKKINLSEIENRLGLHHCFDEEWGENAGEVYYEDTPRLVEWTKRAYKAILAAYNQSEETLGPVNVEFEGLIDEIEFNPNESD